MQFATIKKNIALALLLACFGGAMHAQVENPAKLFRYFKKLDGVWFMATDRGDRLEIWSIANDSTLNGRIVRIKPEDGDTVNLQRMTLTLRDTNIIYTIIPRGQSANTPVPFRLVLGDEEEGEGYVFENPANDDPFRIIYNLLGNRELQVITESRRGSGRTTKTEYVYEREFSQGALRFIGRLGLNVFTIQKTGNFRADSEADKPQFAPRPGWEIGGAFAFEGAGGFITVNIETTLTGKFARAQSRFSLIEGQEIVTYERDLTYNANWFKIAFIPEIRLKRDARLSAMAGPYYARLIFLGISGRQEPQGDIPFRANQDFKRGDFGLIGGLQYRIPSKRDWDARIGLRATAGLSNIDNLYGRNNTNPVVYNGRLAFQGISLYYGFDLSKL
ncbi:MAG: hypothetical protein ACK4NS_04445 [Saprospiraceae bacterium]